MEYVSISLNLHSTDAYIHVFCLTYYVKEACSTGLLRPTLSLLHKILCLFAYSLFNDAVIIRNLRALIAGIAINNTLQRMRKDLA